METITAKVRFCTSRIILDIDTRREVLYSWMECGSEFSSIFVSALECWDV